MPKPVNVKITWNGPKVRKEAEAEMDRRLARAAAYLQGDIQRSMRKGGGGAQARKKYGKVRRSKPGQVPFVQTGKLRQSIFARKVKPGLYEVGTNLPYGVYHELGITYSRVGFQKRPFILPAVKRSKMALKKIVEQGK